VTTYLQSRLCGVQTSSLMDYDPQNIYVHLSTIQIEYMQDTQTGREN